MSGAERVDVLFVATDLDIGGAEREVAEVASRLSARGWSIAVLSLAGIRTTPERLWDAGVPIGTLGLEHGRPVGLPGAVTALRRYARRHRPRLVHSHMIHANLLARFALAGFTSPLVCTSHSDGEGGRARRLAMRLTDPLATMTTHPSRTVLGRYVASGVIGRRHARHVPNGVDLERFRRSDEARRRVRDEFDLDDGTFVWLSIGSLRAVKRHDLMLEAFARRPTGSVLLVAGDGDRRPSLERQLRSSPVSDRVRLLGPRSDPEALMSAADGFVLSSDSEALPLVLAEAAGCGLPIVATDVGGCAELVADGQTGSIVAPGDPRALEGAMATIEDLPAAERAAMGSAGREAMQRGFEIESVVDRWEALYAELGVERPLEASAAER